MSKSKPRPQQFSIQIALDGLYDVEIGAADLQAALEIGHELTRSTNILVLAEKYKMSCVDETSRVAGVFEL